MAKYKIVISDYYYPDIHEELEEFRRLGDDVEVVDCTKIRPGGIKDPTELLTYAHDCDALITQFAAPIDAAFMDGLEKCRVIVRYAIGLDTVDLAAAKKRGITAWTRWQIPRRRIFLMQHGAYPFRATV